MVKKISNDLKKVKVCILLTNDFKNDARVRNEARSLVQAGFDVTVLATLSPSTPASENWQGVEVLRIIPPFQKNIKNPFIRKLRNFMILINIQRIFAKKAAEIKADIYHANDLDTLYAAHKAATINKSKLIYDSHEFWTELYFTEKMRYPGEKLLSKIVNHLWKILERRLIKKADKVITVNPLIADELSQRYNISIPNVIYNYPQKLKNILPKQLIKTEKKIIIYQGAITSHRGLPELIHSMTQVVNGVLVLLGAGEQKSYLRQIVEREALEKKVFFHAAVPYDELLRYTKGADIGIISIKPTCLHNKLCSPNKLFEYMMAGLAVAASDLPFLREVIVKNKIGQLFNPCDPKSIAKTLNQMINNEEQLNIYKKNSASKNYIWQIEEKKLIKIYDDLSLA